jgi:hypothetical protein
MRRLALRAAAAVLTLTVGISAAGAWDRLGSSFALESEPFCATYAEAEAVHHLSSTPPEQETAKREILEILRQYDEAQTKHDASFFERVEADGFTLTMEGGKTLARAEAIALMKTWDKDSAYSSDDFDFQFYGDVVVVTGRMTETKPSGYQYSFRWIDLFANRNGRWQILNTTVVN